MTNIFTIFHQNGFNASTLFLGNSLMTYLMAFGVFFGSFLVFLVLQRIILYRLSRLAEKTKTNLDDVVIETIRHIRPPVYLFLSFYIGARFLSFPDIVWRFLDIAFIIIVVLQILTASHTFINFLIKKLSRRHPEAMSRTGFHYLSQLIKGALWLLGILLILSNLGVNVTSLIAGLGIGGLAVAFALQSILADLFCAFVIYFDQPFEVGDFIIVGKEMGTVEKIGLKTTRLRALQGEEIVISNQELTASRIQNFKKMQERRVVFTFGVEYETSITQLRNIPKILKEIIRGIKTVRFDRAHFNQFGDSALNFEIVYYVKSGDYEAYMDTQQTILLAIHREFRKEGINMAFPTQTVHLIS